MRFPTALTALSGLTAAVLLSSCSSLTTTSSSTPRVISKQLAERLAAKKSSSVASTRSAASTSSVASTKPSGSSFFPATASTSLKATSASLPKDKHGRPSYGFSTRNRVVRTTAYSHMENEPGAPGRLNAIGTTLRYGMVRSAAADWSRYPVGTKFKIKGIPYTYVVDDYGSALVGTNTVDIYHPNLSLMRKWGTREVEINVIQWGSWERTVKILKGRTKYPHCRRMYTASVRHASKAGAAVAQNQ